ncbi:hypothetical protein DI005_22000 [Prauserella sp. PE36]|nr:hypothetical protein DI005_22000 [Prauserella sp. PE36]
MTNGRSPVVRSGADGANGPVERLVEQATALELRAPELALVLGERAASLAEAAGFNELWVRAESVVVHARVQLGHRASTVGRAVAALRAAEDAGLPVVAAQLRTDLAVCSRSVGAPLTGLAALRPVLTVSGLSATQRAAALCHLVGCLGTLGRKAELDRVLMEGDRLVTGDTGLGADDKLLARALIRVAVSAHRRRHGDVVGAADAARTGLGFLDHLEDKGTDGGLARVRLTLELVCALLDRGEGELALEAAQPLLAEPERAASVAPTGWLRLALATRVLASNGSADAAGRMLRDALHSVGRHELHALASRLWLELANIEERIGEPSEAIACLHNARSSEHLHARARSQARASLTGEFGSGEQAPVDLADVVATAAEVTPPAVTRRPEPEAAPEPAATSASAATAAGPMTTATAAADQATAPASAEGAASASATPPASSVTETPSPASAGATGAWAAAEPEPFNPGAAGSAVASKHSAEPASTPARSTRPKVVLPMLRLAPELEREETTPTGDVNTVETLAPEPAVAEEAQATAPEPTPEPAPKPEWQEAVARPEPEPVSRPREHQASGRSTRHDSEHGSVAARSVLDRLGISPGAGGGRRRAAHSDEREQRPVRSTVESPAASRPEPPAEKPPPVEKPSSEDAAETGSAPSDGYGWLPRLRLPPSLAPLDELGPDFGSDTGSSIAAEPSSLGSGLPLDEPPPDAGLAELLARALAEHRAGTSSAAALVKQLGTDDDVRDGSRRVNGGPHHDF